MKPKYDKVLNLKLTGELYGILTNKAMMSDLTISAFVRILIANGEVKKVVTAALDPEVRLQLYGISNNLNQMAKRINQFYKLQTITEGTAETISKQLYLIDLDLKAIRKAIIEGRKKGDD
jgi:hypothetical protein